MTSIPRVGDLEIEQDLSLERTEWAVQRITWLLFLLLWIAAVLGFLGHGLLSKRTATSADGLTVEYHRFIRSEGPTEIQISVPPAAIKEGEARVWLSDVFLRSFELDHVDPEPERMEAMHDGLVLVLRQATSDASGSPRGITARLRMTAEGGGDQQVRIAAEGSPGVEFHQFVFP